MSMPIWTHVLYTINLVASTAAAICGAIVGAHAVIRLLRRSRKDAK